MGVVLYNGKIRTESGFAEAMAWEGGRITDVGSNGMVLSRRKSSDKSIDLKGRLVLPGFNDSHLHFLNVGNNDRKCDLGDTRSLEEALEKIRKFIEKRNIKPGDWVDAYGWNEDNWKERRKLTKADLDRVSTIHPIFASRVCCHVGTANSPALRLSGIQKGRPQPEGGAYGMGDDGEPDGILYESFEAVQRVRPKPTVEELKKMLVAVCARANQVGITSVQSDDFHSVPGSDFRDVIQAYRELVQEERLTVRVYEQCALSGMEELRKFWDCGYRSGKGDSMYRLGPLKLFCDGSLGARTAWLAEPYSDDPGNRGIAIYPREEDLFALVEEAHKMGMAVAIHCIGDKAAEQAVKAIEKANDKYPGRNNRHGLVHAQILNPSLCKRMQKEGIHAYIQPIFIEYDLYMAEDRVGSERIKSSYNWRDMKDMGIILAFGSDSPVENFRPVYNIYSAVTRKDLDGRPADGWYPRQALTLDESIDAYTRWSAYASYEEEEKGRIAPGMFADLVVMEEDLYEIEPEAIKDVDVFMTVVDGKIRYHASEEQK